MRITNDGARIPPTRFLRTDRDGLFRVSGLHSSSPWVWARAPGFAVWREQVRVSDTGVSNVEIRLLRGATIAGRILDLHGEPAENVRVDVLHEDIEPFAGMGWAGPSWARPWGNTDQGGRFLLEHVKPGRMRVRAQRDRMSAVAEFTLLDGQHETWEAVLGSGGSIRGVLTDEGGAPLSGWRIHGRPSEGQQGLPLLRSSATDEQGLFD